MNVTEWLNDQTVEGRAFRVKVEPKKLREKFRKPPAQKFLILSPTFRQTPNISSSVSCSGFSSCPF